MNAEDQRLAAASRINTWSVPSDYMPGGKYEDQRDAFERALHDVDHGDGSVTCSNCGHTEDRPVGQPCSSCTLGGVA